MNSIGKLTLIGKLTPQDIVNNNISFAIPLYQRLFVWGLKEVNQLMDDLIEHYRYKSGTPYYIGMITTVRNNGTYELTDGQQRFTMLMLIGICQQKFSDDWRRFVQGGARLKFVGRDDDEKYLSQIASVDSYAISRYTNKKMDEALCAISAKLNNEIPDDDEKLRFARVVFADPTIFNSILPEHHQTVPDSLNRYFEAMNSTGKSLEQHEILKVELLRQPMENKPFYTRIWNAVATMDKKLIIASEEDDKQRIERYREAIECCKNGNCSAAFEYCDMAHATTSDDAIIIVLTPIKEYKFQNSRFDKEASIINFPELLLVTLSYMGYNTSFCTDKLTETFKKEKPDATKFFETLLQVRLLLDLYVIRKSYSEQNRFDYRLLFISTDKQRSNHDALEQYLAMMDVSISYPRWLVAYLKYVSTCNQEPSSNNILIWLRYYDTQIHPWPTGNIDKALSHHIVRGNHHLSWRLEYLLWEKAESVFERLADNIKPVHDYCFRSNNSVEYLHPQEESNNDKWAKRDDEDIHLIHSFGNLAPISQSFNSTQGNDPVHVKFARVEDQVNRYSLQSLKMYHTYLTARQSGGWSRKVSDEHKNMMLDSLADSYNIDVND